MVKAIVGANWGDEGKGKITDLLAEHSDIVVRFQGGANAGHTIINDYGRFSLHILPSGSFYSHVTNVIGNGVALDVKKLVAELKDIQAQNAPAPNLMISERVQLLMPYHVLQDTYEEERLGGKSFGSTKSGIAPFYSDKYAKIGIQLCDLFDEERLMERLTAACEVKNVLFEHLYHKPPVDPKAIFDELMELRDLVRPYVGDTVTFLHEALKEGKTVLLEGQLGSMKDPDLGIYPMTTSSPTLWLGSAPSAPASRPPRSAMSLRSPRLIPPVSVPRRNPSSARWKEKPVTSCGAEAATRANSAPQQGVPAEWAGSIPWPPSTAARCRVLPRWR